MEAPVEAFGGSRPRRSTPRAASAPMRGWPRYSALTEGNSQPRLSLACLMRSHTAFGVDGRVLTSSRVVIMSMPVPTRSWPIAHRIWQVSCPCSDRNMVAIRIGGLRFETDLPGLD